MSTNGQVPESATSWCHAPFDPEGVLRWPIKPLLCFAFSKAVLLCFNILLA
jgi:hypothetical protein